jgi:hypothetical protein
LSKPQSYDIGELLPAVQDELYTRLDATLSEKDRTAVRSALAMIASRAVARGRWMQVESFKVIRGQYPAPRSGNSTSSSSSPTSAPSNTTSGLRSTAAPTDGRRLPYAPWQRLNLLPEPHGHGSLRPVLAIVSSDSLTKAAAPATPRTSSSSLTTRGKSKCSSTWPRTCVDIHQEDQRTRCTDSGPGPTLIERCSPVLARTSPLSAWPLRWRC